MSDFSNSSWSDLVTQIGLVEVNEELDKRVKAVYETLYDLTTVCSSNCSLFERITALMDTWHPEKDKYERNVVHFAAVNGNTRLVRVLIYAGCPINERDGIGQTALTLALHKGHANTAKFLIGVRATVDVEFF